ncbi:MAG: ArsR/SmtB family transcription factor [Planctomycetota bacterium]|jgi:ArsR family transcriptional regulator
MDNESARNVAEVLKAVAHPARLRVIELLEGGEKCVGEIVEALGEKQAITSQHLNLMRDKGILSRRREGANVYYRIENKNVIKLLHCVHEHCKHGKS